MLNCGYVGEESIGFPEHLVENSRERASYLLYWKVLEPYLKNGDSILEIGCGSGGGLAFVAKWKRLDRVVGVDFAGALIRRCRRLFGAAAIEFRRADALALPFDDKCFDVAISVESSHGIEEKDLFLEEALRVLRRGGVFVWVDFIYSRASSMHSLERCEAAIAGCGAKCIKRLDMSENALASLRESSPERIKRIEESVWKPFQGIAKDFAVTEESSLYRCLAEERGHYCLFVLRKV